MALAASTRRASVLVLCRHSQFPCVHLLAEHPINISGSKEPRQRIQELAVKLLLKPPGAHAPLHLGEVFRPYTWAFLCRHLEIVPLLGNNIAVLELNRD